MVHAGQRAHLLHTLAHHELQAAELFAWAILAFPDTPPTFRAGLLRIALEELEHLELYRDQLQRLGRQYPSEPVRDWFWERATACQTPTDFVAFMGLGLEGANLEHSARFAAWFREAGDEAGAAVLDQVERDEIGHVAFARQWFERWTGAPLTLERWQAHLPPPLTPAVFRGQPLNREARRRAGLNEAFLDALDAAAPAHRAAHRTELPEDVGDRRLRYWLQSEREPVVWILNLDAEEEWAHERAHPDQIYVRSPKLEAVLRAKRRPLLTHLVQPQDWVWPSEHGRVAPAGTRAIAWSPTRSAERIARERGWVWEDRFPTSLLPEVQDKAFWASWTERAGLPGPCRAVVTSWDELAAAWSPSAATPWRLRRPLGAAGRHAQLVTDPEPDARTRAWIDASFAQGALIAEPQQNLAWEASTCGWIDQNSQVLVFPTRHQNVDAQGAWLSAGSLLHADEPPNCVKDLQKAARLVGAQLAQRGYRGPFSVDGFAYRRADGSLGLQAAGDINARWTMAFGPALVEDSSVRASPKPGR